MINAAERGKSNDNSNQSLVSSAGMYADTNTEKTIQVSISSTDGAGTEMRMSCVNISEHQQFIEIIILLKTVCRSLQAAVLARSSREIYQTVRIDFHSFLSCVRYS